MEKLAVIFDMDGVIIDSNPLVTKVWKRFFAEHGMDNFSDQQLKNEVFGRTTNDTITNLFKEKADDEQRIRYKNAIDEGVQELYKTEGNIVEGFKAFVESLKAANIAIAIGTSAPNRNVEIVMEIAGTKDYFDVISDASHVQHSKPHPEIYLKTSEKLGIEPRRCCVFEDSLSGIEAAKRAGMKVVGVATTHTIEELAEVTDAVINDYRDISVEKIREMLIED